MTYPKYFSLKPSLTVFGEVFGRGAEIPATLIRKLGGEKVALLHRHGKIGTPDEKRTQSLMASIK